MQRVALLGLGTMGAGMAANWLAKGFGLTVWNRTRARTQALAEKGARVATTPREAAEGADCVFAMVADDVASRAVWLGDDGALAGAKAGAVVVESSTLTPDWVRELAGHARVKGCAFLDAPVGGSRQAAASGELRLFVGGDAATLDKARPALIAIGSKIDLLGPAGAGATWKLINNQLIAAQVAALGEALDVARKSGFRPVQISSLILNGAAASPIVKMKLPSMLNGDYDEPDFALSLMLKDARYAAALAQSLGAPADLVSSAVKAFARAEAKGLGAKDIAAVAG
ncbi:MAG: NAD(P)-dependent oxidoreductase [Roseiarcus sp.]|uniref:NAD(P)-dependent oxidoreductase n=1 Tax=Roseiarcus sp. TaxID=1969460 RepID=UPI003C612779